jgi:ABC-2 type transport system ATP-binding protein
VKARESSNDAPLRIEGLTKSFPVGFLGRQRRTVLTDLSLSVAAGEVFGYLGPNGSGKTTTLKVLMGLVSADSGTAHVLGRPLRDRAWRRRAGYLPEHPYFYDYLTPVEYLDYVGRLFELPARTRGDRARRLLARVGLEGSSRVPMRRFSKGMSQRVGLAQALINEPDIVFLDEPMSGLDPIGRHLVRDIILELRQQGRTVFFSTHILPDAEALCDRVALLRRGRLVNVGRLDQILAQEVSQFEVLLSLGTVPLDSPPAGVVSRQVLGERLRLVVWEAELVSVLEAMKSRGARVLSVSPVRQSLEEYFLKEMGDEGATGEEWSMAD